MLRTLLSGIKKWLEDDEAEWFDGIAVVVATKGELASTIDAALGKLGLCIVIEAVSGKLAHLAGNLRTEPLIHITVYENVLINRQGETYKTAEDVMERVAWMLRGGQATPPPVYAQTWMLVDDSSDELTYGIDATTRGAVTVEVAP